MSCQRTEKMKLVANLKDKMIKNEKCQWVTLYISNCGYSAINEVNINKSNNDAIMKVSAIKSATAHILVRCAELKNRPQ